MSFANRYSYRFFQCVLFFMLFGLAIGLYSSWYMIITQVVEWQKNFHDLLATHINAISQDPIRHGLSLITLSFLYGVFHAVGPGHGKAVIITYLSSHKESLRRGAMISFLAALFQAIIAVVLVTVLAQLFSISFSDVNNYANDITTVSYLLVMVLGAFLFSTALFNYWRVRQGKSKHHHHDHDHDHDHDHSHSHHKHADHHDHSCCGGHHVHQSEPEESWFQSLGVIVSMGMRPCTGAILVLIYAHLVGVFYYGVIATLVMGFGTGLAIASMALGTQLARNWFEKFVASDDSPSLLRFNVGPWLRMAGGAVIFLLGLSLFQAAMQISSGHPLS